MKIGFIGAGRTGVSLGKYFKENGLKIGGYYSRTAESARWAAEFTQSDVYDSIKEIISSCSMVLFTVPDDAIAKVWEEAKLFVNGSLIGHCSGLHSSNIFSDADSKKCSVFSVHPLCAISSREHSWENLPRAMFTIEGNPSIIHIIEAVFRKTGNRTKIVNPEQKALYHAAAAMASNQVTAVISMAAELFYSCGFSQSEAEQEAGLLAEVTLKNIGKQGCVNSLTGPVERNDLKTITAHLAALDQLEKSGPVTGWFGKNSEIIRSTYRENTKYLIRLSQKKNPIRDYSRMNGLICGWQQSETETGGRK